MIDLVSKLLPAALISCLLASHAFAAPVAATPLETGGAVAAEPVLKYILVIYGENTNYTGAIAQPYLAQLVDTYPEFTGYYGVSHPSEPNYLALTSGATHVTSNSTSCLGLNVTNIADGLEGAGLDWRCYNEGMGADPCALTGNYVIKHNFMINYSNVASSPARTAKVKGFNSTTQSTYSELLGPNPPTVVFVAPDLCHDGHDCGVATFSSWLSGANGDTFFQDLLGSKYYTEGAIFVAFDEDEYLTNHVYCVGVSALGKTAYKDAATYTHYSMLRTIEDNFGLATMTANDAAAANMLGAFAPPSALPSGFLVE
ncbi:alkaline phosphatase family protein [soil metagenome]